MKTGFGGWALVRVTKITPGSNKTLADVKEDIRKNLADQLAANKLVDVVNAFTDAKSSGGNLKEAAQEGRHEAQPSFRHRRQRQEARRQPRRGAGRSGIPARLVQGAKWARTAIPSPAKAGAYFAVHVNGVTPPKLKPLDQVRAQVVADWTNEQRAGLLANKARELSARAAKEKSLDGIAKDLKVTDAAQPGAGPRDQRRPVQQRCGAEAVQHPGRRGGLRRRRARAAIS